MAGNFSTRRPLRFADPRRLVTGLASETQVFRSVNGIGQIPSVSIHVFEPTRIGKQKKRKLRLRQLRLRSLHEPTAIPISRSSLRISVPATSWQRDFIYSFSISFHVSGFRHSLMSLQTFGNALRKARIVRIAVGRSTPWLIPTLSL